jgi:ATP/maltotriose-dependent transcriptional regulator MalT
VDGAEAWRQHQSNKLRLLTFWRDASERRLAALNAAISTLEQQIARDQPVQGS